MISQQHFENFFCCFDHCCSLLSQGQPGAVIWTRCKCMERNDELKAYTTGGSPSWEDSSSTKGGRMACKCALLNKGVPPDQMLSTWQEALQSSPGPLPDVLKPCLQLPAWSSPWFLPGKKGCLYTDVGIWKSAHQNSFLLHMNFVKTGGKNLWIWTVLDLHGITPLQEELEIMHLHQDGHLCSRGKKALSCCSLGSAGRKNVFSYYWKGNAKWGKWMSFK